MHIVTRTQLGSTEDDNQRLRLQLSNLRKRYTHTASEDRWVFIIHGNLGIGWGDP